LFSNVDPFGHPAQSWKSWDCLSRTQCSRQRWQLRLLAFLPWT